MSIRSIFRLAVYVDFVFLSLLFDTAFAAQLAEPGTSKSVPVEAAKGGGGGGDAAPVSDVADINRRNEAASLDEAGRTLLDEATVLKKHAQGTQSEPTPEQPSSVQRKRTAAEKETGTTVEETTEEGLGTLDSVDILARAIEVERELEKLRNDLKVPVEVNKLRSWLRSWLSAEESELAQAVEKAQLDISEASRWFLMTDIQFEFSERLRSLDVVRSPLYRSPFTIS